MGNSTLHAIAIEELRHSNPSFYHEYCELINGISGQIRELAQIHTKALEYTSFTESYDRATLEPVLQIVIGALKTELYVHIYIHQDHYFVIGQSGSGKIARTAQEALDLIKLKLNTVGTSIFAK